MRKKREKTNPPKSGGTDEEIKDENIKGVTAGLVDSIETLLKEAEKEIEKSKKNLGGGDFCKC